MPQNNETANSICILDGNTFLISSQNGDFDNKSFGLFHDDTRFLSHLTLEVNHKSPIVVSAKLVDYFSAIFFLSNEKQGNLKEHAISIIRRRIIDPTFQEEIEIANYDTASLRLQIVIGFDSDFADFIEVREKRTAQRKIRRSVAKDGRSVCLSYRRDGFLRSTTLTFSEPALLSESSAEFALTLTPKQVWKLNISANLSTENGSQDVHQQGCSFNQSQDEMTKTLQIWEEALPSLHSNSDVLDHAFNRSCIDLAALRIKSGDNHKLLAAGLPWFMTLFGRDSLTASYQSIILGTKLAETCLIALAKRQGTKLDNFRDEEPGKILHELRLGELTLFGEEPYSPYFGSVDGTMLFVILLSEVWRWTGNLSFVQSMLKPMLNALDWMEKYGDADGDGFIEYKTKSKKGLHNQGWKDSGTAIQFLDGTLADPPIALCEVQGYAYDAYLRAAELMQALGESFRASELEGKAAKLKTNFNDRFWLDSQGYFALGLDKDKRPIDALSSNAGHLLWSGIADKELASPTVEKLMSESMYSGWGIRTLSDQCGGFNPIAYHCGTVWPHDNSIIAAGLRRYGFHKEAARLAKDMLEAAAAFQHRLPEAFAGYRRHRSSFPARYPTSCSPQAWASGAPLLLLRTLLGIEPNVKNHSLDIDVWLPEHITDMTLDGIKAFGKTFRVTVANGNPSIKTTGTLQVTSPTQKTESYSIKT